MSYCPVCGAELSAARMQCPRRHCGVYRHDDGSICGHAWVAWIPELFDVLDLEPVIVGDVARCAAGYVIASLSEELDRRMSDGSEPAEQPELRWLYCLEDCEWLACWIGPHRHLLREDGTMGVVLERLPERVARRLAADRNDRR